MGLRPVLHWTLDEAADAGLLRAIIVTNPHKPMLEAAARNYEGPLELEFVPQDHPRGLGDAFLRARDHLAGAPFLALLPDNLFTGPNPDGRWSPPPFAPPPAHRAARRGTREHARGRRARPAARPSERAGRLAPGYLDVADKGADRFDAAGEAVAVTPIGRMAFPGDILDEFDEVGRGLPPGVELDDVPVLQRLAAAERAGGRDQPGASSSMSGCPRATATRWPPSRRAPDRRVRLRGSRLQLSRA